MVKLDEEQAIAAGKPDAPMHLALQHDELLPQRRILGFKPALGLQERGHQAQGQEDQCDHRRQRAAILSADQSG